MKRVLIVLALLALASPAQAQFGRIGDALNKGKKAVDTVDSLTFSDAEERQIGQEVSDNLRARYGVVQDPAVHKYVALVGTALAWQSSRPSLLWTFIVLDTDGVNAFAAPGGFIHITRGALALIDSEAELAGVLGHEIGHVTQKHTINAIRKSNAVKLGSDAAGSRNALIGQFAGLAYTNIIENAYDRGDENDADGQGVQLAQKAGYRAGSLGDFLNRLAERNQGQSSRNGLFASHPETKERISRIAKLASSSKNSALGQTRFTTSIKYEPTPITEIAVVEEGAAGLTGGGSGKPAPTAKKEEPKKGLAMPLTKTVGQEKQTSQVSASQGARGVGEDRYAKGGPNPSLVKVSVTTAEVDAFRKGIV
jgi:predicted Zn-dependent protease